MITFVRVAGIAPGKTGAAVGFAHEIAAYFKSAYGIELEVLMPVAGNPARVAWSARYPDLATVEKMRGRMLADPAYLAMTTKASELFVGGSLRDDLWHTV